MISAAWPTKRKEQAMLQCPPPPDVLVHDLYAAVLDRAPDADGLAFWVEANGRAVAIGLTSSDEALAAGLPTTAELYRRVLGREPDAAGEAWWSSRPYTEQVLGLVLSEEASGCATVAHPDGWVDGGHGVMMPPVLLRIRHCESRDYYQAANRMSSARGAYQWLRSTWQAYGFDDRYGVPEAHLATEVQQDEAAVLTWQQSGTRPWNASKGCWG